jgi:EmrB/QacA subfamily drug resistance transporter
MPTSEVLAKRSRTATLVIVSLGLFMVVLAYAVLLLTGSVLGDRFGRKRMFIAGILLFTAASAASALAPNTGTLIAARALQGVGAAIVTPLTLTLLADAFPPERRGIALGVWSGISGTAVALGPLVGGAMIQIASWHWIFWINVPVGLVLAPVAARRLNESYGSERKLDTVGLGLSGAGLFGIIFGLIRSQTLGWGAAEVLISLIAGAVLMVAFIVQELRTDDPMLPMAFFKRRSFAVTNIVSLSMYFGMFGSVFFMSQYLQDVIHNTPFQAGLKLLVWTGATMLVAPAAGYFSERFGARLFMVAGLALQGIALAWLASETAIGQTYSSMIVPFIFAGSGMALVFAPSANAVLSSVRTDQAGQASGATNAIRELGGVLGISVLSTVFTSNGSYSSGTAFIHGLTPAVWVGAAVLFTGALVALVFPFDTRVLAAAQSASASASTPAPAPAPVGVSAPTTA